MPFSFLFLREKTHFFKEKRVVFEVGRIVDGSGESVKNTSGEVVRDGSEAVLTPEEQEEKLTRLREETQAMQEIKAMYENGTLEESILGNVPMEMQDFVKDCIHKNPDAIAILQQTERINTALVHNSAALSSGFPKELQQAIQQKKEQFVQSPPKAEVTNMIIVANNPQYISHFSAEQQEQIRQQIQNILQAPKEAQYSENTLKEQGERWKQRGEGKEDGIRKKIYANIVRDNENFIDQVALFELAQQARNNMVRNNLWQEKDLLKGMGVDITKISRDPRYDVTGAMANNIIDKDNMLNGLASGLAMGAGALTVIFNLIAFIQSGGDNTQALAFAAAGAGVATIAKKNTERNIIDSMLHPENKALNEIRAISHGADRFILFELTNTQEYEFYNQINFGKKENQKIFSNFVKGKRKSENKTLSEYEKSQDKKGKDEKSPKHFGRVSADDFINGDLHGILREGADTDIIRRGLQNKDVNERMKKFRMIEWMYSSGLTNEHLPKLQEHAEGMLGADMSKLTNTEEIIGMKNRFYDTKTNTRMEEIIHKAKK